MAYELKKRFIKKIYGGLAAALSGLLCCACGMAPDDLSTFPQDETEVINNLSTLSTEESTSVDNENVNNEEEYSDEEMKQEIEETSAEEEDEGTERDSEIESEEASSYMDEILADAEYYYVYYATVYQSIDEETALEFDEKAFAVAYKSIKNETLTDYFSDISWLSREEGISLSFTPNEIMFPSQNKSANLWMARCIHAFELIEAEYSSDENWDNPDSLKPQFHCHAIYARQNKVPWNIEPYRTETSFLKIVLASGNPDS